MIIHDGFLTPAELLSIKSLSIDSPDGVWRLKSNTNTPDLNKKYVIDNHNVVSSMQLVSNIFPKSDSFGDNHPAHDIVMDAFSRFLSLHQINSSSILRSKFNILFRANAEDRHKYNLPHIDVNLKHLVFLCYLNDSDGDTVFFNETFDNAPKESLTEYMRVSPKAGTVILFDGTRYHASSPPVMNDYRWVLNIDFLSDSILPEIAI